MVVLLAVELVDELLLAVDWLISGNLVAAGLVLMVLLAVELVLLSLGTLDRDGIGLEANLGVLR